MSASTTKVTAHPAPYVRVGRCRAYKPLKPRASLHKDVDFGPGNGWDGCQVCTSCSGGWCQSAGRNCTVGRLGGAWEDNRAQQERANQSHVKDRNPDGRSDQHQGKTRAAHQSSWATGEMPAAGHRVVAEGHQFHRLSGGVSAEKLRVTTGLIPRLSEKWGPWLRICRWVKIVL